MEQYTKILEELLDIKDELYLKGLITPFGGNISVRCPDDPSKALVTPGSVYKKNLKPEHFIQLDLQGNILNETKFKPTSETPIHLAILRARPDVNAVIHTHPVHATTLGVSDLDFLPITADAVIIGNLPIVEWTETGSPKSGQIIADAIGEHGNFVLIRNHGLFVCGPSLQFAAGITDMIETVCKELVLCKMMGVHPRVLPKEKIAVIHELMKSHSV
ncbi:class II aldolase/adducin family protein [Pelolinea submarina]|uniref:L-fuculose-phosphate aldolase n=1 Tax=Pelolinea submarina TaxID=913107 RepID=A0A347ZWE2_9CHLR|nr:class II aldolase/adducin family protein [Pelolinea submarina]REG05366.1 L-fuculose-phosphate aldolase [Pelolinea submarina]BBB49623.1 hypothetical protein Pelsub_P2854 [Pelolinea submarina]